MTDLFATLERGKVFTKLGIPATEAGCRVAKIRCYQHPQGVVSLHEATVWHIICSWNIPEDYGDATSGNSSRHGLPG